MNWYNVSAPLWRVLGRWHLCLWTLFNRRAVDAHYWGAGLLQIGQRHLFYVGHEHGDLLFVRLWTTLDHEAHGMTWKFGLVPYRDRHLVYVVRHRGAWGVLVAPMGEGQ